MALSYINYPADGSTTQFDITFGYLRRSHVFVFVENNITGFKWISSTRIEITPAPADGTEVRIQRLTDKVHRITDFADGQTLLAGDLDAATLQNFYLAQEMLDGITDGVLQGDVILNQPLAPNGEPLTLAEVQTLLDGAAANSPVIQQLLGDVDANGQNIFLEAQERLAGLQAETQARVDAIAAEADLRQAALTAEAQARLDALAGIQTQLDADVANLTQLSGALTQEVSDRQAAVQATATSLAQEVLDRQTGDNALDGRIDAVVASVGGNSALIATETQARVDGDASLASQLTVIQSSVDGNTSQIASEITARTNADIAFTSQITSLASRMGDAEAGIISVNEAVATETTARSTAILGLQTQVDDANAQIASNQTAISNESTARASDVSTLLAEIGDNEAAIIAEQVARSNAVSSVASDISALTTRVGTAEGDIVVNRTAISTETSARVSAIAGLQAQVNGNVAAIISEASARSSADDVQASQINGLTTRMGDAEAGIVTVSEAVADEEEARAGEFSALRANLSGGGGNLLRNSTLTEGVTSIDGGEYPIGWTPNGGSSGIAVAGERVDSWKLQDDTVRTHFCRAPQGGAVDTWFEVKTDDFITVDPTQRYIASAHVGPHRGEVQMYVFFYDAAKSFIGTGVSPRWDNLPINVSSSTHLDAGVRAYTSVVPNPGAYYAKVTLRCRKKTPTTGSDFYLFWTKPMLEVGSEDQQVPSPWQPGSGERTAVALVADEALVRASADTALASDVSALTTRVGDTEADIVNVSEAVSDEETARAAETALLRASVSSTASPTRFSAYELFTYGAGGYPDDGTAVSPSVVTASAGGYGDVIVADKSQTFYTRKMWPLKDGGAWRFKARMRTNSVPSGGESPGFNNCRIVVIAQDEAGDIVGGRILGPGSLASVGVQTITYEHTTAGIVALRPGAVYFRIGVEQLRGAVVSDGGEAEWIDLDVEDVSEAWAVEEDVEAQIVSEASARASADIAQASDISGLSTRMGDAEADILSNTTAISDEEGARVSAFTSLKAGSGGGSNLIENASFLAGETGGVPYGFAVHGSAPLGNVGERTDSWAVDGDAVKTWEIRLDSPLSVSEYKELRTQKKVPVIPGQRIITSAYVGAHRCLARCYTFFFKEDGSASAQLTGSSQTNVFVEDDNGGGAMGNWSRAYNITTVPSDAAFCLAVFRMQPNDPADATAYMFIHSVMQEVANWDEQDAPSRWTPGNADTTAEGAVSRVSSAFAAADGVQASDILGLNTRMGEAEADITTVSSVAADAQGRAQAIYGLRQDVNGYVSGFGLSNDGATSDFAILADTFTVARPGHGAPVGLFTVNGSGTVVMQNALIGGALIDELTVDKLTAGSLNVDVILRGDLDLAEGRITTSNGVYMKVQGVAFGANNDLIEWFGPQMAITSCTKANAIMYADTAGNFHLGGGVTAEWASIQNVSVSRLQMATGAVGAATYGPYVASYDLTSQTNPLAENDYNAYVSTGPWVPVQPGDVVKASLEYRLGAEYNAYEYFYYYDQVSIRTKASNGTISEVFPVNSKVPRVSRRTSNTGGGANIGSSYTYDDALLNTVRAVIDDPDVVEVQIKVTIRAENPGTSVYCTFGGNGSIRQSSMSLKDVEGELTVFSSGPLDIS